MNTSPSYEICKRITYSIKAVQRNDPQKYLKSVQIFSIIYFLRIVSERVFLHITIETGKCFMFNCKYLKNREGPLFITFLCFFSAMLWSLEWGTMYTEYVKFCFGKLLCHVVTKYVKTGHFLRIL